MRVLVLVPAKSSMHPILHEKMMQLVGRMPTANQNLKLMTIIDLRSEPTLATDCRAWSKVARVRNRLLDSVDWRAFDYVLWIDADVVDYPPDLPTRLTHAAAGGIAAPIV